MREKKEAIRDLLYIMTQVAEEKGIKVITAPFPGIFYQSFEAEGAPFVKVGDTISAKDDVCFIEVMNYRNEVSSEVGGTVTEILVKDGEYVEYGQALFRLK